MLSGFCVQEFRANGSTKLLVRGKDASLGHFVDHQINEPKWEAWKVLPEAVRTGQVAFALAHDGMDMHQARWYSAKFCAVHRSESFCLHMTLACVCLATHACRLPC